MNRAFDMAREETIHVPTGSHSVVFRIMTDDNVYHMILVGPKNKAVLISREGVMLALFNGTRMTNGELVPLSLRCGGRLDYTARGKNNLSTSVIQSILRMDDREFAERIYSTVPRSALTHH